MPDLNLTLAAINSSAVALERAITRHAANGVRCKQWSAGLVALFVFLTAGRPVQAALLWVMAPVALLAVADACEVALVRRFTDAYNRFMQKLPLNGGNAMKAEEFSLPDPVPGWRQAGQVLGALGSFSVWPFYGALLALLVAFHMQASQLESSSARLLTSSATKVSQSQAKPSQGTAKASLPMKVAPLSATENSPRQNPAMLPPKTPAMPPQQPGTRIVPNQGTRLPITRFPVQNPVLPPKAPNGATPNAGGGAPSAPPQGINGASGKERAGTPALPPAQPPPSPANP